MPYDTLSKINNIAAVKKKIKVLGILLQTGVYIFRQSLFPQTPFYFPPILYNKIPNFNKINKDDNIHK